MRMTAEKIEYLKKKIPAMLEQWGVPSVSVGITENGQTLLCDGFGLRDLENAIPADAHSLYMIGSCTKAFTSALAAIMVDQGKLDWDTPIVNYVPDVRFYDDYVTSHVTIRDLLCHRTGMPRHEMSWYQTGYTKQEIIHNLRYLEPNKPFRTAYQYNNQCFLLAGYVVEAVSGMKYEDCLKKYIFEPLGMTYTSPYVYDLAHSDDGALPYAPLDVDSPVGAVKRVPYYASYEEELTVRDSPAPIAPAGCICSCAEDMLKWIGLHLNHGTAGGRQIISAENLFETEKGNMFCGEALPPTDPDQLPFYGIKRGGCYGLGWHVSAYRGERFLSHGGAIDGFSTRLGIFPELGFGVFLCANRDSTMMAEALFSMICDLFLGADGPDWNDGLYKLATKEKPSAAETGVHPYLGKREDAPMLHPLSAYVGRYIHKGYRPLDIELEDGKLYFRYVCFRSEITHFHNDAFTTRPQCVEFLPDTPVIFRTDGASGRITGLDAGFLYEPGAPLVHFERVEE